ncbi:hypothetical protein F66182_3375 [Fusarium sp. NRRL 66182]|nr:hypothetical protein F66182_3375 [Fusarium sp. NRRL 66182]
MSSTADTVNLVNLPTEIRLQIYRHYFKAPDGYVYDGTSDKLRTAGDNSPIELSLIYTCRSIANDTRHLPLRINTIHFSTLYREDWRSLAGCFNLVATYHRVLEADFVLHLAQFMTEDMHSQLHLEHPEFGPQLKNALRYHVVQLELFSHRESEEHVSDQNFAQPAAGGNLTEATSTTKSVNDNPRKKWSSYVCGAVRHFLEMWDDEFCLGFLGLDSHLETDSFMEDELAGSFWKLQAALSSCLRIIAENKPAEFTRLVRSCFPNWTSINPVQDFLNLGFKQWAIPSQTAVLNAIDLLNLGDVWQRPDSWHHALPHEYEMANRTRPGYNPSTGLYEPFGVRCREKFRFSAAACAIRFLERLPIHQRTQIRTLILQEDFRSVNYPSVHAQGLAPFFEENPFLRVERRVSLLHCVLSDVDPPFEVAAYLEFEETERNAAIDRKDFGEKIADWLLDALAVTDSGIPAESFTLVLEAGPHRDYCADLFQRFTQREIAWSKAYKELAQSGFSFAIPNRSSPVPTLLLNGNKVEALDHLANHTSAILSCDFNTGVAWDVEALVNETRGLSGEEWVRRWQSVPFSEKLPPDLKYKDMLTDNYDIQTEEDCS